MIPCGNPGARVRSRRAEIDEALKRVLDRGVYILGPEVAAFEEEFASWLGVEHAVGVANGTDALELALRALDIGPGDEVVTVSHTASATVAAIVASGATPVFADIEPATFTMDPRSAEAAITPRTKAIVPVHIYGHCAEMGAIRELARGRGLKIVEDCAQAHGARCGARPAGSFGDAAAFSFYPTKNLGALGDGGAVVTPDPAVADRVRALREYGWTRERICREPGTNSRLDEIQAAVLRVGLARLDADNARRAAIAARYDEELAGRGIVLPAVRESCGHVYHLYVVRTPERDRLVHHLHDSGVGAAIHYAVPNHHHPAFRAFARGSLPETDRAAGEILSLPLYPEMAESEILAVIARVIEFRPGANR